MEEQKPQQQLELQTDSTPVKQVDAVVDNSESNFKLAQRKAVALSKSELLPKIYQNNIANCMIAMELANRTGMNELMVMQNLHIIQGRPSWSSTFCISAINSSKRFKTPLNFQIDGSGDTLSCVAFAIGYDDQRYESPRVTMQMAKDEGWLSKSGSKWKTMPELMIRYRSAAFFSRLFCPELLMGMQTQDEIIDITGENDQADVESIKVLYNMKKDLISESERTAIESVIDNNQAESFNKVINYLNSL
jgi:hypothetical protein